MATRTDIGGVEIAADARLEIIETAAAAFSERGYAATSIDDIARRMGATKGRVYHHFSSKAALFCAVYRHGVERLADRVTQALAAVNGPAARLAAAAEAHVYGLLLDMPYHRVGLRGLELVLRGATTPAERSMLDALAQARREYEARFAQLLSDQGAQVDTVTVKTFLICLNGPCFWFTRRPSQHADELEALARRIARQALHGVTGPPAPNI